MLVLVQDSDTYLSPNAPKNVRSHTTSQIHVQGLFSYYTILSLHQHTKTQPNSLVSAVVPDHKALSDPDVSIFPQHAGHINITDATVSMLDLR